MTEILFTFEATTTNGFLVGCNVIDENMHYREYYKKNSKYVFEGKKYTAYCLFNTSRLCTKERALKIISSMLEKKGMLS